MRIFKDILCRVSKVHLSHTVTQSQRSLQ